MAYDYPHKQIYTRLDPVLTDSAPAAGSLFFGPEAPTGITGVQLAFVNAVSMLSARQLTVPSGEDGYRLKRRGLIPVKGEAAPGPQALKSLLESAFDMLTPEGTAAVLTDTDSMPIAKQLMDEIFGRGMLFNEIVLYSPRPSAVKRSFARRHYTLLLYGRSSKRYINTCACGRRRSEVRRSHMKRGNDMGREYTSMQSGGKEYRYYDDELIPYDDVWQLPESRKFEYAEGQLPPEACRRLLLCLTNKGDAVAELCCGSAQLCACASALGRPFTGWDYSALCMPAARAALLAVNGISFSITSDLAQDGSATVNLDVINRDGHTEVALCLYSRGGQQQGTDGISFWAVGNADGDAFTVTDYSQRTYPRPTLRQIIRPEGASLLCVCDAFGNEKFIKLSGAV